MQKTTARTARTARTAKATATATGVLTHSPSLTSSSNIIKQQVTSIVQQQVTSIVQQQVTSIVQQQVTSIVQQRAATIVQEQVAAVIQQQLANITVPSTGEQSNADIARTTPGSYPSNLRSLSINTTPSTGTDKLYCTLVTSQVEEGDKNKANLGTIRRAIETEVQNTEGQEGWRCVTVTKDPKNPERIRVACRSEAELIRVKEAVKKTSQLGTRMLQDQTSGWPTVKQCSNRPYRLFDCLNPAIGTV
jgi:molybdopterin-binding protein